VAEKPAASLARRREGPSRRSVRADWSSFATISIRALGRRTEHPRVNVWTLTSAVWMTDFLADAAAELIRDIHHEDLRMFGCSADIAAISDIRTRERSADRRTSSRRSRVASRRWRTSFALSRRLAARSHRYRRAPWLRSRCRRSTCGSSSLARTPIRHPGMAVGHAFAVRRGVHTLPELRQPVRGVRDGPRPPAADTRRPLGAGGTGRAAAQQGAHGPARCTRVAPRTGLGEDHGRTRRRCLRTPGSSAHDPSAP
jgi:hypothetical protein